MNQFGWVGRVTPCAPFVDCQATARTDQIYVGRCPDVISGIHGKDPVKLYAELCEVVDQVIEHLQSEGRTLPPARTRPMQEVV